jgi:hypothetical protein
MEKKLKKNCRGNGRPTNKFTFQDWQQNDDQK